MNMQPESIISLSNAAKHVTFCLDGPSAAVLTVIRTDERLQSWWVPKAAMSVTHDQCLAEGLSPCEVSQAVQDVIDRRWAEVETVRSALS